MLKGKIVKKKKKNQDFKIMNDISNDNQNSNQLCNAVIHVNDKHVLLTRLYKKKPTIVRG